jgi:hypothetical protein
VTYRKRASICCGRLLARWDEIDDKGQKTCRPSGRTGNKLTAKTIDIEMPTSLQLRVDQVIE